MIKPMTTLTLNEIRSKAVAFAKEWADGSREAAEAKLFWRDFFDVFGLNVRRIGIFERAVIKLNDKTGYIDLLWPGHLLVEHKSKGQNLESAFQQGSEYAAALKEHELPRLIIVSDFQRFQVYDLEDPKNDFAFALSEFPKYFGQFAWIAGYSRQKPVKAQDPVNIQAAEKMGKLHDLLEKSGYKGHKLEVLLVRLLFCLFAEDTGIFEPGLFSEFIEVKTSPDGGDLGSKLGSLFDVLDQRPEERQTTLDESLAPFPWVNGSLFKEPVRMPSFTRAMREMILDAAGLSWSEISPAIFGSLFQSIMDKVKRRNLGAHYTSEENILKVVNSLFLWDLRAEFEKVKSQPKKLHAFHEKLGTLRFLDPACGCGNFLVVAYRELRELELEIIQALHQHEPRQISVLLQGHVQVSLGHFSGIEVEEFPVQIARVAMWLVDHQMNQRLSSFVGKSIANIPLIDESTILHGNALRVDWRNLVDTTVGDLPSQRASKGVSQVFVFGNPPFIGSKQLKPDQKADIAAIFGRTKNAGVLDYVACWYRKATDYLEAEGTEKVRCAFVSTSSITQGEQVSTLWGPLLERGVHIDFAHRTFHWSNEGKANAAVHCVIVGFSEDGKRPREIFDYPDIKKEPHRVVAQNINPYLIDFEDILIPSRSRPLCSVPELKIGNKPIDDGNFIFTDDEKEGFLAAEAGRKGGDRKRLEAMFHPFIGSEEFLNGGQRWILLLKDLEPNVLKLFPEVMKRVAAVRDFRLKSTDKGTRALAATPTRFHVENHPKTEFLVVPEVSSERRHYLPMGFINDGGYTLCSNLVKLASGVTRYQFGVLSSAMHMAWMRTVCGRLESRYRYSTGIVYNNFPWPSDPSPKIRKAIEDAVEEVLSARAAHPASTLSDLYDPDSMPPDLAKAHAKLDKAVDAAYELDGGQKTWSGDLERAKFLFLRYKDLAMVPQPLLVAPRASRPSGSRARRRA